jgi:hypothetical protein
MAHSAYACGRARARLSTLQEHRQHALDHAQAERQRSVQRVQMRRQQQQQQQQQQPEQQQQPQLSAYEVQRNENVARNNAVLASLGLVSGGSLLQATVHQVAAAVQQDATAGPSATVQQVTAAVQQAAAAGPSGQATATATAAVQAEAQVGVAAATRAPSASALGKRRMCD